MKKQLIARVLLALVIGFGIGLGSVATADDTGCPEVCKAQKTACMGDCEEWGGNKEFRGRCEKACVVKATKCSEACSSEEE